jgi:hypothetical protein
MLKKIIILVAVLLMVSPTFGAWSRFLPKPTDPNYVFTEGVDPTVDWEVDGNSWQRKAEPWNWPATYDYVPMCDMRVQMDVGFWIKLTGCKDTILKLKQVFINEYYGEAKCTAYTNVDTQWKAEFFKYDNINLGTSNNAKKGTAKVTPEKLPNTKGAGKELVVSLKLWDVDLSNIFPNMDSRCTEIGKITISVRPDVRPNYFMNACDSSQKYPTFAPTK